jgi:hypothetical protein
MTGWEQNSDPECFLQADVDDAAERLAEILREENADVLTVFAIRPLAPRISYFVTGDWISLARMSACYVRMPGMRRVRGRTRSFP